MAVLVILSMNGTINLANNDNDANYYLSITGMYSTIETLNIDGEEKNISFTLYLLEDGTFKYEYSAYAPVGVIGNYIIDDDIIILNYMFNTNSGTDLEVTEGTKKLIITDDKKIVDNDYKYKDDNKNIDSIKLSYKGVANDNFNINNMLKSSSLSEKDNTNTNLSPQEEIKN